MPSGHPPVDPPLAIARACVHTRPHFALYRPARARGYSDAAASSPSHRARRLSRVRATDACCWWHRSCRDNVRGLSARLVGRHWTLCRTNAWLYRRLRTDCLRLHAWFAWWLRCLPRRVTSVRAPKSRHGAPLGQSVVRVATAVSPLNGAAWRHRRHSGEM
jgi:hypothetical protein